jgi:hypothetical protein
MRGVRLVVVDMIATDEVQAWWAYSSPRRKSVPSGGGMVAQPV